jgi:hypothetical protein
VWRASFLQVTLQGMLAGTMEALAPPLRARVMQVLDPANTLLPHFSP